MPKRTDLKRILIIGSGPIVIGQACEFDYSGTQGCRALREEGFEVVLVNSNPATIMTDPDLADRTYVEPLTPEFVAKIIECERPQALLPTLGGQTALNIAVALAEDGTLDRFGVELIGAKLEAIRKAEDRALFKQAMERIGLALPRSGHARSLEEARTIVSKVGYPAKSGKAARDVSADDFDLIVVPGGFAPDFLRRHEAVLKLVGTMAEQGKVVAAICHGPWVLCSTQALKGKKATCFFAIKDDVINAGATYVDAEMVRDGNLITSRKPDDLPAFLDAIIQAVQER